MRRLTRSFAVFTLAVCLSTATVQARPTQDPGGEPGLGTRIVQLIKHFVRGVLEDPSMPKP